VVVEEAVMVVALLVRATVTAEAVVLGEAEAQVKVMAGA
jgi:hypothetical protein